MVSFLVWRLGTHHQTEIDMNTNIELIDRLKEFMENEARSCSMDPGCITPEYVYRMWGGSVAIDEIKKAMEEVRRKIAEG